MLAVAKYVDPHAPNSLLQAIAAMSTPGPGNSTRFRPRSRHESNEEDDADNSVSHPSKVQMDTASPLVASLRVPSPNPSAHSLGVSQTLKHHNQLQSNNRFLSLPNSNDRTVNPGPGLWETSLSSLRGIASNLMKGESSRDSSPSAPSVRQRKSYQAAHGRNTTAPPRQWGPSTPADKELGSGTREQRRTEAEAKKRERLLIAHGHIIPDGLGRYKRRDSDERNMASITSGESEDNDALVYLHKVKPGDTLAGVLIKYNCQPNVFKKANRMWPNDSIQVRKTVVLPVSACGVKGRKIPDSESASHHLVEHSRDEIVEGPKSMRSIWGELHDTLEDKETPLSSIPTSPSISVSISNQEESHWNHDSWVLIEGFSEAVEIVRMSRRALGYFPRPRRKSQGLSDFETPSASFELPRGSFQSSSPRLAAGLQSEPNSSIANFQGPGGVGTMSRNVRSPGPANDGLNKLFPTLEQNVAPKKTSELQNSDSLHLNGLENIGGAIETWVRKVATKASTTLLPPSPHENATVGNLIELSEDAFDLEEESQVVQGKLARENTSTVSKIGDWNVEQERILQERFPPRGRIFGDSSKKQS